MAGMGFEFGSHTVTHANLGRVAFDEAQREIIESKRELEKRLERPVRWLAYPFGGTQDLQPEVASYIEEAGYDGCLSAYGGFVYPGCNERAADSACRSPSFKSVLNLELHLTGCLNWMYALKRRLGLIAGPENSVAEGELGLSLAVGREVYRQV